MVNYLFLLCIIQAFNSLFIKISSKYDKCFVNDIYSNDNLLSYKIHGLDKFEEIDRQTYISSIVFKIYHMNKEQKELVQIESANAQIGKFTLTYKKDGEYRICLSFNAFIRDKRNELSLEFEITSKHTGVPKLDHAVKNEHIEEMDLTLKSTIRTMHNAMYGFDEELRLEEDDAHKIEKSSSFFSKLTLFQLLAILFLFFYQIYKGWGLIKLLINN